MAEENKPAIDTSSWDSDFITSKRTSWDAEAVQALGRQEPVEPLGGPPEATSEDSQVGLWESIKGFAGGVVDDLSEASLSDAVAIPGRAISGAMQSAGEFGNKLKQAPVNAITEIAAGILLDDDKVAKETISYLEETQKLTASPTLKDTDIDKWFGPQKNPTLGLLEEIGQFTVGAAVLGGVNAPTLLGKIGQGAALDAATTTLFMNDEANLSTLVQDSRFANPINEYLAIEEDDGFATKKLKAALEGAVTAGMAEAIIGMARRVKFKGKDVPPTDTPPAPPPSAVDDAEAALQSLPPPEAPAGLPESPVAQVEGDLAKLADDAPQGQPGASNAVPTKQPGVNIQKDPEGNYILNVDGQPLPGKYKTYNQAMGMASTAEVVMRNERLPKGLVDLDELDAFRKHGDGALLKVNYAQSREEALQTIVQLGQADLPVSAKGRVRPPKARTVDPSKPTVVPKPETIRRAESIFPNKKGDAAILAARQLLGDTNFDENLKGLVAWSHAQGAAIDRLTKMVNDNPNNAIAVFELGRALSTLDDVFNGKPGDTLAESLFPDAFSKHAEVTSGKPSSKPQDGRKGSPKGKPTGPENVAQKGTEGPPSGGPANKGRGNKPMSAAEIKAFKGLTPEQIRQQAALMGLTEGDTKTLLDLMSGPSLAAANRIADPVVRRNWMDYVKAWYFNSILSAAHANNVIGGTVRSLQMPVHTMVAGLGSLDARLVQEGWDTAAYLLTSARENLEMAKKALKQGGPILDAKGSVLDIPASQFGEWDIGSGWSLLNANNRLLMAEDEFFKQANYRAKMRAEVFRKGRENNITDTDELQKLWEDSHKLYFDEHGAATNADGIAYARDATFTTDLERGSFAEFISKKAHEHLLVGLIFPVVKTPYNVFRHGVMESNPLTAPFVKRWREDIKAGGVRRKTALAKVAVGSSVYVSGVTLAYNGVITGNGPKDANLRREMVARGWKPRSFTLDGGKTYTSYDSLGHLATPLVMMADAVELISGAENAKAEDIALSLTASLTAAGADQTYLGDIHDVLEALHRKDGKGMQRFLAKKATAFVPNLAKKLNPDDYYRDTQGFWDEMRAEIPGWSDTLPARRNIFNEPIENSRSLNPFHTTSVKDAALLTEFMVLGKGIQMPQPTRNEGLLDLRDRVHEIDGKTPYEYLLEKLNEPVNGKTLKDEIAEYVQSEDYKKLDKKGGYAKPGGPAYNAIGKRLERRVARAEKEMWAKWKRLARNSNFVDKGAAIQGRVGVEKAQPRIKEAADQLIIDFVERQ